MTVRDINWRTFIIWQVLLFSAHVVTVLIVLDKPLIAAAKSYAVCLGLISSLFLLAYRTIMMRGWPGIGPHPRFPTGQHPHPKLQLSLGTWMFSGLLLAMFWPWDKHV
jgi:hypothetical protein